MPLKSKDLTRIEDKLEEMSESLQAVDEIVNTASDIVTGLFFICLGVSAAVGLVTFINCLLN